MLYLYITSQHKEVQERNGNVRVNNKDCKKLPNQALEKQVQMSRKQ